MSNPKSQNVIVNIAGDEDRKRWERLQESMRKAKDFSVQQAALDKVGEGINGLISEIEAGNVKQVKHNRVNVWLVGFIVVVILLLVSRIF